MNTNKPRILTKLAIASWLKVYEHWLPLFENDEQTKERMGWVKFEDNGEMFDGATTCWLKTFNWAIYKDWERLFAKVRTVLYEEEIIDRNGYLLIPLTKEVVGRIKESFSKKRSRLIEARAYEEEPDFYTELPEIEFSDEDEIDISGDDEEEDEYDER